MRHVKQRLHLVAATMLLAACSAAQDAGPDAPAPYASELVSFLPGGCAGFGKADLPKVVLGPPAGGGETKGSLDVLSLGAGGSIVLGFAPHVIVDGPGADFIVFENAFRYGAQVFAEPGRVEVSEDGKTWVAFPCDAAAAGHAGCAGKTPTLATPENKLSDTNPATAGGDAFDLSSIGVARARFVRITDISRADCDAGVDNAGFDLDAVSIVHAEVSH